MLRDSFVNFYKKLRLMHYRELFGRIREKDGSLSATEAFAVDVIYLLGNPTITQLADTLGISQPNATYKVNNLTSKGYVNKTVPEGDKRECRVTVCDKFFKYYDVHTGFLDSVTALLEEKFSPAELDTFERILDAIGDVGRPSEAE
jgi:DNA-binding MarR family transcriptional regulator